jgi:hypothetical protein
MGRPIRATIENVKKYGGQRGVVMYSPKTGEQYSATPGDYWQVSPKYVFKGEKGAALYLGKPFSGIEPITGAKKKKSGSWSKTNKRRKS